MLSSGKAETVMWVAVLLIGWLVTSLLAAPWIGRFIAAHARIREQPPVPDILPAAPETAAKPMPLARRA
jgi:hypothetical protein